MTRREFTKNFALFVVQMIKAREEPIFDYFLRDAETQKRLFDRGLSKCDGYKHLSRHQFGTAGDMYFVGRDYKGDPKVLYAEPLEAEKHPIRDRYVKWHKIWEEKYGGKPMITWDCGHWES